MQRIKLTLIVLLAMLGGFLFVPSRVATQAPSLIFGSSSNVPQVIKATSNALWVSVQSMTAGTSTATYHPGGAIYYEFSGVSNAADTNFVSNTAYALPANVLAVNGDQLRVEALFVLSADTGNKTLQCNAGYSSFSAASGFTGGINVVSFGTTSSSQTVVAEGVIRRTSTTLGDLINSAFYTTLNSWQGAANAGASFAWTSGFNILCAVKNASGVAGGATIRHVRVSYSPAT